MFQLIIKDVVLFVRTVAYVCFYPKQSHKIIKKKKTLSPLK